MLFAAPPPPPVSFSREIAPILAMHCNSCHGDAGGISTRSYAELMRGGNLGKVIVPGDPDQSLLVHFLDGRRGEAQRMPKESQPLSEIQIRAIRRWIAEGATNDNLPVKTYRVTRKGVRMELSRTTRVFCRVNTQAYLELTMRDPVSRRVLWSDVATVKKPGKLMSWDLRAGYGWPNAVTLELAIRYAASAPRGTELYTRVLADR
jgi:hypothetical protein